MAIDTGILPTPDDLSGWKAVEKALNKRLEDRIQSLNLVSSETLRRYFGCKDEEYLLCEYEDYLVMEAFIEWLIHDYRLVLRSTSKKRKGKKTPIYKALRPGKTLAERLLAEGLPAAEAEVLEACARAYPSIYRVTQTQPGVSLCVEDVLLGGERAINDKLFSGCVRVGDYIVGRVFPVGRFYFYSPAGPPLPVILVVEATEYLESLGVQFTPEGLRRGAGKFGRLWNWYDDRQAEGCMPQLRNTDGEKLVWQTASFSVSDEADVRKKLDARDDIDYDPQSDEYLWFRYQGEKPMIPGETLSLGRMRFVADELILDVNSAERLAVARQWLEKIDGVRYRAVKTRDLTEGPGDVPMDDRMKDPERPEMTPEEASGIQDALGRYFRQYYMEWLDAPVPMLDGKSPRQACKIEAYRNKVAVLIRTIPTPIGGPRMQVDVPRQEMLRELGLS